jgi:glycine reductase
MRLQIESIDIKDIQVGSTTTVSDHTLSLNLEELEERILEDARISSVELNIVSPGDRVRIVNIADIIQPRCKIDADGEDFPGWLGKLKTAGKGRTRSLRGIAVVVSNSYATKASDTILDMYGKGARISKYGTMKHLSIHPHPSEGTEERDFEHAVKVAGLKTAVYLAKAAEGHPVDQEEVFELSLPDQRTSDLPKVAYYDQLHTPQHDYQGMGDPILYASPVTDLMPTIVHPNEILDGGLVSTYTVRSRETYVFQNHAVIRELYRLHNREIAFAGVVVGVASVEPVKRERMSMMAANLISNVLGAEGVVLTKGHGGMAHVDLGQVAELCEEVGIKTTLFAQSFTRLAPLSDQVLFSSNSLNAIVNVGQTQERVILPHAERILGGTADSIVFNPDFKQKAGDSVLDVEEMLIAGVLDHTGGARIRAIDY